MPKTGFWRSGCLLLFLSISVTPSPAAISNSDVTDNWRVGTPIVSYWCGPSLTDATARQYAAGGFNVVWCGEKELDLAQKHGLRAQLSHPLLSPATLDIPAQREELQRVVEHVRNHPAMYSYFITDEPNATNFAGLGKLVGWLRERDPDHLAYLNLFPTYASNEQLGTTGDTVTAYKKHLDLFVNQVKPALISYDHYQFATNGDNGQYFLNLALIRRTAQEAKLPFLNIVQACTWTPVMRVPGPEEMRFLVYTTLAYGAQGISYYVYSCANHTGGIAAPDGTPTPLYHALKQLNVEFVAIARELQRLQSVGVYHAGSQPTGTEPVPDDFPVKLQPPPTPLPFAPPAPVTGLVISHFRASSDAKSKECVMVVNLDYKKRVMLTAKAKGPLEMFDAAQSRWPGIRGETIELNLQPGGGALLRLTE